MHVAVTIVGFRNLSDIRNCFDALEQSTHKDFEIIICENGGVDAYAALQRELPLELPSGQKISYTSVVDNLGYAGGVNLCIRQTPSADAWWILNPDTRPEADALSALVQRLNIGDCDAVGGTIYLPTGRIQSHGGRWRPWLGRAVAIGFGRPNEVGDQAVVEARQNFLSGASMLVGASFVSRAGLMREDYFLYCEEVEWCLRASRRGAKLAFSPEARVLHEAGTTTGSHASIRARPKTPIYLDERNKLLLTRDLFPYRLPLVAISTLLFAMLRFARRGAWRQLSYALSGWLAGVRGDRGRPPWISP